MLNRDFYHTVDREELPGLFCCGLNASVLHAADGEANSNSPVECYLLSVVTNKASSIPQGFVSKLKHVHYFYACCHVKRPFVLLSYNKHKLY